MKAIPGIATNIKKSNHSINMPVFACVCHICKCKGVTFEAADLHEKTLKGNKCTKCKGKNKYIDNECFTKYKRYYCFECKLVKQKQEIDYAMVEIIKKNQADDKRKREDPIKKSAEKKLKSNHIRVDSNESTTDALETANNDSMEVESIDHTTDASETTKDDSIELESSDHTTDASDSSTKEVDVMTEKSDSASDIIVNITKDDKPTNSECNSPSQKSDKSNNSLDYVTEDNSPKKVTKRKIQTKKEVKVLTNNFLDNINYLTSNESPLC